MMTDENIKTPPPKRTLNLFWRTGLFGAHSLILLSFLLLIGIGAFIWRINNAPFDIGFAKTYIESALFDEETGNHARMDSVVLYWPDLTGALYLQLGGAKILNRENEIILSVDEIALSFSRLGLLMGKLLPKSVILENPLLRISRREDNSFDFGFEGETPQSTDSAQQDMLTRILGYLARPGQESANKSILSHLEAFEIENARLVVSDHILGVSWYVPEFNAGFFSTSKGMNARFTLALPQAHNGKAGINIALSYLWDTKEADADIDIRNFDLMVLAGKMPELQVFSDMNKTLDAKIKGHLGRDFMPDNLLASLMIDGVIIDATADFEISTDGFSGKAHLSIPEVAQSKLDGLWPEALRGDNSEYWIVHKMADGIFRDVWASAEFTFAAPEDGAETSFDAQNVKAGFSFENMSVDYRHPLPAVTGAYGKGGFDLNADELSIEIERGFLGAMEVTKANMLFDRVVAVGEGGVDMDIYLAAQVRDVLRYVSTEPINMRDRLEFDIEKARGESDLHVNLKFPTQDDVKLEDFEISANGTLRDIFLPAVVQGLDVSGGPMNLSIKDSEISVKGSGMLDNRPMEFAWSEFLEDEGKPHVSKVKASLAADANLRTKMGINLDDFIDGTLNVSVDYTSYHGRKAVAYIDVDATPAIFFVTPFDYTRPAGEPAQAKLAAHFQNGHIRNITDLTASGKDFTLAKSTITFETKNGEAWLSGGELTAFTLDDTKGKLDFKFDANGTVQIVMDAPYLDAQSFLSAKESTGEYKEPPMKISVTAKTMRTAPEETVTGVKIYMDIDDQGRFNQMEMDAVAGDSPIYLRYKPDADGKRVFRLQTDDAGAALKAFQVYNDIRGGKMIVYGEPVGGVLDRNISGIAEITDFRVVNAPVLSRLLSLMSITGIAELMAGEGLNFSRLEADFKWTYRKGGALLTLSNGRTSGNTIGLTFDGTFDNGARTMDVSGTIMPLSQINTIIRNIPLVGNILTGGTSGVFAATYSIKGSYESAEVGVNPLSVLAPGIIRRILFE